MARQGSPLSDVFNRRCRSSFEASNSILMLSFPPPPPSEVAEAMVSLDSSKQKPFPAEQRLWTGETVRQHCDAFRASGCCSWARALSASICSAFHSRLGDLEASRPTWTGEWRGCTGSSGFFNLLEADEPLLTSPDFCLSKYGDPIFVTFGKS